MILHVARRYQQELIDKLKEELRVAALEISGFRQTITKMQTLHQRQTKMYQNLTTVFEEELERAKAGLVDIEAKIRALEQTNMV
jgi:hypothetical protein